MTQIGKRWIVLGLLAVAAGVAEAQQPGDTMRSPPAPGMQRGQRPPMSEERLQQLRMQVEERFGRMVQQELQLDDEQMGRVRTATRALEDRRRVLQRREMDLRRAMQDQMQPGVAANQDSLGRMLDAVGRLEVERAQSDQQYLRDLQFLTPVQRTRLVMMQRRFQERVRAIRERQRDPGAPGQMGPGAGRRPGMGTAGAPPGQRPLEDEPDDELALLIEP